MSKRASRRNVSFAGFLHIPERSHRSKEETYEWLRAARFVAREFLGNTGRAVAASALAGVAVPAVHAAENNTIQIALVGCGGRGTGAAANALAHAKSGPIKLVAMADVFEDRLNEQLRATSEGSGMAAKIDVDLPSRRQVHRLRRLPEGHGLPQAGRRGDPDHAAGLPLGALHLRDREGPQRLHGEADHVDGPTTPQDARPGEEAKKKNLKVGVGLMCRHCDARRSCSSRIKDGQIGDIVMLRAYRQTGPVGSA